MALSVSANAFALTIRYAAVMSKLKCAIRFLSILGGCASMVDRSITARAPLQGIARAGRFGAVAADPGLLIEERTDLALGTVMARRGTHDDLKRAVAAAYGLELPDRARLAANGTVSFTGIGVQRWFAAAERAAETDFVARLTERLVGLASVADQTDGRVVLRLWAIAFVTCWRKAFRLTCISAASKPEMALRPWWPISAYKFNSSTMLPHSN
jgi:hypothetical protein